MFFTIHEEFACQFLLDSEDTQQYNDLPDRVDCAPFPAIIRQNIFASDLHNQGDVLRRNALKLLLGT